MKTVICIYQSALLHKSCSPAFPLSQLRGIKPLPKSWEDGKAGEQDLCNKAERILQTSKIIVIYVYNDSI
jgi:hypothetical protein